MTLQEFVDKVFHNIPITEASESMKQEILENLEEKVCDLEEQGKSNEDAVNKAIVDFGDIDDIKSELRNDFGPKAEQRKKSLSIYTNRLWYSIWGSALIIGLFVFINLYYSPNSIWFVYPTFLILWWPLSSFFARQKRKNRE